MARPSKFKPEFIAQAQKLANLGATDREVAEFFGVNEATLNRWKHEHDGLCASLKVGKEQSDARVEQSLYRKALGYSFDAIKIAVNANGEVTQVPFVEHCPPDTTAAIFWLKNRKPAEWRDVKAQELSGPGGAAIVTEVRNTIVDPQHPDRESI
jgi:hypothetical protein